MLVLLAEDERDLAELIIDYLSAHNIECDYATDGRQAIQLVNQNQYDVIILDVMMPRASGHDVCNHIKHSGINSPVLFLTAQSSLDDKLKGFELGADDYLTKPFAMEELVARLNVLGQRKTLRRQYFELSDLKADKQAKKVWRGEHSIQLSPALWELFMCLVHASPNVVSKVDLEQQLWPEQTPDSNNLKMQLSRLRQKINVPGLPVLLHTIKGQGVALRDE